MAIRFNPLILSGFDLTGADFAIGTTVLGSDANSILGVDANNKLKDIVLTSGQLLIGSTGNFPVAAQLTGTSNQVSIANGAGSITLSLPQDIATISSPEFAGLTLTGFDGPVKASSGVLSVGTIDLTSEVNGILPVGNGGTGINGSAAPNGHILIGNGSGYTLSEVTGTTNQVNITNGAGSITLSLPQDIDTGASPEFFNLYLAPSGEIDLTGPGTLAFGTGNASIINIGNSGATVNIQGDTIYQNVTNLNVTDKNITINVGGSVGSASNAGIHVEEGGVVAGHAEVTGNRLGWEFHPPGVAGIATLYPGASGITLDQSSHDPVTIDALNGNGLHLSVQVLSLDLANASSTGALSATDWNTFNDKEPAIAPAAVNPTLKYWRGDKSWQTLDTAVVPENGNLYFTDARVYSALSATAPISFSSGVISISQSNSTTNGYLSSTDWNTFNDKEDFVVPGTTTEYYRGDKTFQTLNTTVVPEGTNLYFTNQRVYDAFPNDIQTTSWSGLTNNTSNQVITGLLFSTSIESFTAYISITIDATTDLYNYVILNGRRKDPAHWSSNDLAWSFNGDVITGLDFNITTGGQVRVDLGNITGFSSGTLKFRAISLA